MADCPQIPPLAEPDAARKIGAGVRERLGETVPYKDLSSSEGGPVHRAACRRIADWMRAEIREIKPPPRVSGTSAPKCPNRPHIGAYPRVFLIAAVLGGARKHLQIGIFAASGCRRPA
jgi:hypothetical protein